MALGKWNPAPLPDGSYADASRPFAAQDLVNYIPEYAESSGTRSQFKLVGAPGLHEWLSIGAGPHRGARDVEGKLFVVADTHLYWVKSATEVTQLGEIPGRSLVWMTHNQVTSGNEVVIWTGSDGYVYNTVSEAFTKITDTAFPGGRCCDFIDQMIIGVDPQGRFLFNSDLAAALNYNDIERYAAEASPDRLVCSIVSHNKVIALGERTIDFFQASQDPTDISNHILFRVEQGATLENGCASRHGVARLDSAVWFIGSDGGFYELRGYTATRVSTFPIEYALSKCNLSKAFLTTFEDRGHKIIYLTCPDGYTFGFDVASRKWHRRQSKGLTRWRLNTLFKWKAPGDKQAKWYGGSYRDGLIYQLDWDYTKEGCDELASGGTFGVLHDEGNRVSLDALRIEFDSGSEESVCVDVEPIETGSRYLAMGFVALPPLTTPYLSEDVGGPYAAVSNNIDAFAGSSAGVAAIEDTVFCVKNGDSYFSRSTYPFTTWEYAATTISVANRFTSYGTQLLVFGLGGGVKKISHSEDNGDTWATTTPPNLAGGAIGAGNHFVAADGKVVFGGKTGSHCSIAYAALPGMGSWTTVTVNAENSAVLSIHFTGTHWLVANDLGKVYRAASIDGPYTLVMDTGDLLAPAYYPQVTTSNGSGLVLLAWGNADTSQALTVSADHGATWTDETGTFPGWTGGIAIPCIDGTFYTGWDKTTNGTSWSLQSLSGTDEFQRLDGLVEVTL